MRMTRRGLIVALCAAPWVPWPRGVSEDMKIVGTYWPDGSFHEVLNMNGYTVLIDHCEKEVEDRGDGHV